MRSTFVFNICLFLKVTMQKLKYCAVHSVTYALFCHRLLIQQLYMLWIYIPPPSSSTSWSPGSLFHPQSFQEHFIHPAVGWSILNGFPTTAELTGQEDLCKLKKKKELAVVLKASWKLVLWQGKNKTHYCSIHPFTCELFPRRMYKQTRLLKNGKKCIKGAKKKKKRSKK